MAKRHVKHEEDPPRTHSGQRRSFSYIVEAFPMALLGGKYTRYGKVTKLLRFRKDQPPEELSVLHFTETWGENTDEAISEILKQLHDWIDQQPARPDDYRQ